MSNRRNVTLYAQNYCRGQANYNLVQAQLRSSLRELDRNVRIIVRQTQTILAGFRPRAACPNRETLCALLPRKASCYQSKSGAPCRSRLLQVYRHALLSPPLSRWARVRVGITMETLGITLTSHTKAKKQSLPLPKRAGRCPLAPASGKSAGAVSPVAHHPSIDKLPPQTRRKQRRSPRLTTESKRTQLI